MATAATHAILNVLETKAIYSYYEGNSTQIHFVILMFYRLMPTLPKAGILSSFKKAYGFVTVIVKDIT